MNKYPFSKKELKAAVAAVRDADLAVMQDVTFPLIAFGERSEYRIRTAAKTAKGRRTFRKTISGIAAAFGIAILGGTTFLTVDADARDAFKTWIREIYENQIVYRFTENGDTSALDRVSIGWVPEGYELASEDTIEGLWKSYYYESSDHESGFILSFDLMQEGYVTTLSNPSLDRMLSFEVNGMHAEYYDDIDGESDDLTVFDEQHMITININGFLDYDEMIRIVNNIYYR